MHKQLFSLSLVLPTFLLADQIELDSGERLRGQLIDFNAGFVTLRLQDTKGEALRRISPEQIQQLEFNDEDMPLEIRAKKRARFLPILTENDTKILTQYLWYLIDQHKAATALNHAKIWHLKNQNPSLDSEYRKILIRSSLNSGHTSEALEHARNWLQQTPPPYSHPLPWEILTHHYLEKNAPVAALKTALTPIAHSNSQAEEQLRPLHKLAAQAYRTLGYLDHANAHQSSNPTPLLEIPTPLHISLEPNS